MKTVKKDWSCKKCNKPSEEQDKTCIVCNTGDTLVQSLVSRKILKK
jgi:RNA polymerase subunit RPABC4/transcription elongation factor Spt4